MILLLMNVGNVLNAGFEIQYLLGNGLVQSVAQTIDIYVLKWGISQNDFAIGTAAGIFKSFVSIVLVVIANEIAKRTGDRAAVLGKEKSDYGKTSQKEKNIGWGYHLRDM